MTVEDFKEGQVLLIDKPLEWSSFQVVNKVRWLIRKQFNIKKIKVGHAGTLDPLATGLLILCTGKFTKKIETYQAQEKEYAGTITLGATTPSYDLETEVDNTFDTSGITSEMIHEATQHFLGDIQQQPPVFSALKKDGKR
ncbi:MAG: tRNA pseudouridine(55) synthase, partial [Flavobacteriaceae bacterium]|nr:tRNA pseudouridine(55) synthase [Flavobacteriaceae bacterium]